MGIVAGKTNVRRQKMPKNDKIEAYEKAEKVFLEKENAYNKAEELYLLTEAERRQVIKTTLSLEGGKPTKQDLEDAIIIERNNIDTKLGNKYLDSIIAETQMKLAKLESDVANKRYWNERGLGNG